jgi:hypothetical protein
LDARLTILLGKEIVVTESKEVKTERRIWLNLLRKDVLLMMMMMMMIMMMVVSLRLNLI